MKRKFSEIVTVNDVIDHIAQYHKEWIKYVQKIAMNKKQRKNAEDFVQDFYMQILESETFDIKKFYSGIYYTTKNINKSYVFRVLKNNLIDDARKKKIETISNYNWETLHYENNSINKEEILTKMESTIEGMYWFDKKLLQLYVYKLPSIRKISKETNIGTRVIFNTLKKCKNTIRTELNEYRKAS